VDRFATDNKIPVVRFGKDDRKVEVMRPYLARQARTGCSGVAAIGIAQEFQNVFASAQRQGGNWVVPWFSFFKADRRVTCFYFWCATRRPVISLIQLGGIWRNIPGSDGLPGTERRRGQ
jgi:hypothetical protein